MNFARQQLWSAMRPRITLFSHRQHYRENHHRPEPDARTNCRTSCALPTVFGSCFTNARSAKLQIPTSKSQANLKYSTSAKGTRGRAALPKLRETE
jgi:hypothetical protein